MKEQKSGALEAGEVYPDPGAVCMNIKTKELREEQFA
jgi:hypothetical protein